MALLGFVGAALVVVGGVSRQIAVGRAQDYVSRKTGAYYDIPIESVRLTRVMSPSRTGEPLPPLGLCWTIELCVDGYTASVSIHPFTYRIVDYKLGQH